MDAISRSRTVPAVAVFVLALAAGAPLRAQTPDGAPNPAKVRIRVGPLWVNPTVALTNLGIDENVFNDPEALVPKRDFTFTLTPTTDLWLRMGSTWINGTVKEELTWYQRYATERGANTSYRAGWKVPLNRLVIDVGGNYANLRDRPGYDIDARSQRSESKLSGAVEIRTLSRTFLGVRADRQRIDFAADAFFLGANLHSELNRVTTSAGLFVRQQLTPLTSVSVTATRSEDRFDLSPLRDSESKGVSMSLAFDPVALIKGSFTVGYRDFVPRSAELEEYRGVTAAVDLSYSLLGMTQFSVRAMRDIQVSFDVNQPYYLQTGINGSIAQQIFGPLDVVGRIGVQTLAYRDRAGGAVLIPTRVDNVRTYGAGVGYRLGKDLRVGFNIERSERVSDVARRQYNGFRFGTEVTYGL